MKIHNHKKFIQRRRDLRQNQTREEELLWQALRKKVFRVRFRRQHSFGGFILDFYCFQARLIIELDGKSHNLRKEYDRDRDRYFKQLGYETLRIKNEEIRDDVSVVIERIASTLSLRLGEGGRKAG